LNEQTEQLAYSIKSFCKATNISPRHYYNLKGRGEGPVETHLGNRIVITRQNGETWLQERTAA
jgi:hypothetical protein